MPVQLPDYGGGSLINLVAELEDRLAGRAASPPLHSSLAETIPVGATYVVLLADGLGSHQLDHAAARPLQETFKATLDAPFPTTTTVSWASIATGLPPSRHGLIAYQLYLPEIAGVAYTIKWRRYGGEDVALDFDNFLPSPNLWERLTTSGVEPITVWVGSSSPKTSGSSIPLMVGSSDNSALKPGTSMMAWFSAEMPLGSTGFNVMSVANNHAMQHGGGAFEDTVAALKASDIAPVGISENGESSCSYHRFGDVSIAIIAYSLRPDNYTDSGIRYAMGDEERIRNQVARLKKDGYIVIVSLHWGEEYMHRPSVKQACLNSSQRCFSSGFRVSG